MSISVSSEEFADMVSSDLQEFVVDLTRQVYNGVTRRTPVHSGQTRRSWNVSKNEPNYDTVDSGFGLARKMFKAPVFGPGEYPVLYVSNGKSHVGYLESGHSKQAPNGMVAVTLLDLGQ